MTNIVYRVLRTGDVGEGGYTVYYHDLPGCVYSGSPESYHGATQGNIIEVIPAGYITESVFAYLTPAEVESIRGRISGIIQDGYMYKTGPFISAFGKGYYCWEIKTDAAIRSIPPKDACANVSCPDKCVGVDKFDQVCQDGICVRGTLIETNSEHCGYTPEPTPEPTPDPTPTPTGDTYIIIIALMLAGTYMILRR